MRLVHLADLHLGYRQYQRLTPGGINQREADVARTFEQTITKVIALDPDVVLIAGDVFHSVRPTNQALLHAFNQFIRLTRERPKTRVIMIAGNHDTPRTAESGGILQLFSRIGLDVVDRETRRISIDQLDLSILAVPNVPVATLPSFDPDPAFRYNVLVLHGAVRGMLPAIYENIDPSAVVVSADDLHASRWSYVALGHYHVYRQVDDNAYYAGAMDYTNLNIWGERYEERISGLQGKSFIERDLETGRHTVHAIPPSRALIDLPPVLARDLIPADVDAQIRQAVEGCPGGPDGKILRLRVNDLSAGVGRELDHRAIREYKRRALSFQLDVRRPALTQKAAGGAPGRRPSLADVVREDLTTRQLDADIDRDALVGLGLGYLHAAESVPTRAAAGAEEPSA